jgi:hypothetical protein
MTEAIFGLLGVVLGGVLTGVVGYVAERRRQRQLARVSARIVREHLLDAMRAGEDLLGGRPADARRAADALGEVWREERRTLAGVMDYAPYADVAAGVRAAAQVPLEEARGAPRERLMELVGQVGAAAHELKPTAGSA